MGRKMTGRPKGLGRAIRSWMQRTGETVEPLAVKVGVSRRTIYRWIHGDEPRGLSRKALLGAVPDLEEGVE